MTTPEPEQVPTDDVPALIPDGRSWHKVPVRNLTIDPRLQRIRDEAEVEKIVRAFDWALFETPTVCAITNDPDRWIVIEGQRRTNALKQLDPDALVMVCHLGVLTPAEAADVAYRITRTRRNHSAYDKWRLRVLREDEHELFAEAVIEQRHLHLGATPNATTIAAVATVKNIIHHYRDPEVGAEHLGDVLDVVLGSWPIPDNESPHSRFDHVLLAALSHLLRTNREHVNARRMIEKLRERPAQYWLADMLTPVKEPRHLTIARRIANAYNKSLRSASMLEL
jgi:hypothetical protein